MANAFNMGAYLSNNNGIMQIPIEKLVPYKNHMFYLYEGERLEDMVQSVKDNGILTPIIVRTTNEPGKYEILAGHNRTNAAKLAGLTQVPAIIKEHLSDEEAQVYVIETNLLQRSFDDLRTSEKAAVLALRHSKMFAQGKRNDIINEIKNLENPHNYVDNETCSPMANKSISKVGNEYGMSKDNVARLLRINQLPDFFKSLIDNGELAVRAGVDLSYLSADNLNDVEKFMEHNDDIKIDMKKSAALKEMALDGKLTVTDIREILCGIKVKKQKSNKPKSVKISPKVYEKYFDKDSSTKEIEEVIAAALQKYFE